MPKIMLASGGRPNSHLHTLRAPSSIPSRSCSCDCSVAASKTTTQSSFSPERTQGRTNTVFDTLPLQGSRLFATDLTLIAERVCRRTEPPQHLLSRALNTAGVVAVWDEARIVKLTLITKLFLLCSAIKGRLRSPFCDPSASIQAPVHSEIQTAEAEDCITISKFYPMNRYGCSSRWGHASMRPARPPARLARAERTWHEPSTKSASGR